MKSISSNVSVSRFGGTGRDRNPSEKHVEIMISPQEDSEDEYKLNHHPMTEKFKVMNSEIAQMFIRQKAENNFYGRFQNEKDRKKQESKLTEDILRHYLICKKNNAVTPELLREVQSISKEQFQ